MCRSLQPYVPQPATVCAAACNPTWQVDDADGLSLLLGHFQGPNDFQGPLPRVMGIDAEWSCAPRRAAAL